MMDRHRMTDRQLLGALARDLDATFEALLIAHQDRVYTLALRFLGNPADAEEAAQDAFVRAYRALGSYEPERVRELELKPWLTTIVLNVCRNRVRRHQPTLVSIDGGTGSGGPNEPASVATDLTTDDAKTDPDSTAIRREGAEAWARLLVGLPERYRVPILLRHVDGLPYHEMSAVLGRPEGTLKAQVHRGLGLLRTAAERANLLDREEMTA
jgi:RNA polymerase sigma factor (sigma-70 family)